MNAPTDIQIIEQDGKPAFAVLPWSEYEKIRPLLEKDKAAKGIPQKIVERHILEDVPLVKAWREHLGISQIQLAAKAGMKQPALSRIERGEINPRRETLLVLAKALELDIEQIIS